MNPPPGRVVGLAVSEDPWEIVISGKVELNSGNPEAVDEVSVDVMDPVRLVVKCTGSDIVVLNPATVVEIVKFENGAVVVLGAATFVVVLNSGVVVIVMVVAVVVLVTRIVRTVGVKALLVRETEVELGETVEEVREESAESIAELKEESGTVVVIVDEMMPVKKVGTAISLELPLPAVPSSRMISINCNSNNRICKSRSLSSLFGTVIVVDCLFAMSVLLGHTYCWNIPRFGISTAAEPPSRLATATCRVGIRPANTSCS